MQQAAQILRWGGLVVLAVGVLIIVVGYIASAGFGGDTGDRAMQWGLKLVYIGVGMIFFGLVIKALAYAIGKKE